MNKVLVDIAERTAATFAFAFLSALSFSDLSTARDAAIAGAAGAASVLKNVLQNYLKVSE
jgi:hypothetical protein